MRNATAAGLILAIAFALCASGGTALAGDEDAKKDEGTKKVADGTKLVKDGVKDIATGTAAEAEKGVTGFFKGLPWFTSPLALLLGLAVGFVLGKVGGKGAPKKPGGPGGDKKK